MSLDPKVFVGDRESVRSVMITGGILYAASNYLAPVSVGWWKQGHFYTGSPLGANLSFEESENITNLIVNFGEFNRNRKMNV